MCIRDCAGLLDDVRGSLGCSLHINSGVRCPTHNANVRGRPGSLHLQSGALQLGHAADVTYSSSINRTDVNMLRLYILLESFGRRTGTPIGLGLYDSFVHVEVRVELGMKPGRWSQGFPFPKL